MKQWFLGVIVLLFSTLAFSQTDRPRLRWFNSGISDGVSNIHFSFIPSLDLSIRGTTVRVMPLWPVFSVGVTQNIVPMSPEPDKQVGYFVLSVYYNRFNGEYKLGGRAILDQDKFTFLAGLKMFFGKQVYAHLQIGTALVGIRETDNLLVTRTGFGSGFQLSAELDLGINLWPHYTDNRKAK